MISNLRDCHDVVHRQSVASNVLTACGLRTSVMGRSGLTDACVTCLTCLSSDGYPSWLCAKCATHVNGYENGIDCCVCGMWFCDNCYDTVTDGCVSHA